MPGWSNRCPAGLDGRTAITSSPIAPRNGTSTTSISQALKLASCLAGHIYVDLPEKTADMRKRLRRARYCRIPGRRVSFSAPGAGLAYLLGMAEERPGELTGQISINELLIAMGEAPVVSMIDLTVPDDASSLTDGPPTLPGL